MSQTTALELAEDLFYLYRRDYDHADEQKRLAELNLDSLMAELNTDARRKAFWINVYNVFTQLHLEASPEGYENRARFFGEAFIPIAQQQFSLNKVEHGILRRSQVLWGLGLIPKPFPGKLEKRLRVEERDYRVHFALNCGAVSCPPIAYYEWEKLDEQLELAEASFIAADSEYDSTRNEVTVSRILSWYRADFGGKKGIRQLLVKHAVIPKGAKPRIRFRSYNWSILPKNYGDE